MTIAIAVAAARLKEWHGLTRARRAIASSASDGVWVYILALLDARLSELCELLEREDPQTLAEAEALQAPFPKNCSFPKSSYEDAQSVSMPALPRGSLIH